MRWESLNRSKLVIDELHPGQGIGRVIKRQSTLVHIKFKSHTIKYRKADIASLVPAARSETLPDYDPIDSLMPEGESLLDFVSRFGSFSPVEV